jgi:uncharacterized protein YdaU (DUF1376 family)
MHFYQFHIGDYKSHTSHLTPMEDLAFRRLLDFYYLHEHPIKHRDIARQIGLKDFEQDVLTVLEEFFLSTDAGFVNPRADKEIAKYREFSEAGKRGAAKRWGSNGEANSPPNATPIATNNHKPITINHKPKVESTRGSRLSPDFCLTEDWKEFCQQDRPDLNPSKVFETFKDYWVAKAGQQGVKLDWFATWRNWVRSQNQAPVNKADQVFTTVPSRFERDPALIAVEQKLKEGVPMPPEIKLALERLRK